MPGVFCRSCSSLFCIPSGLNFSFLFDVEISDTTCYGCIFFPSMHRLLREAFFVLIEVLKLLSELKVEFSLCMNLY
jgi:hypothetical protein